MVLALLLGVLLSGCYESQNAETARESPDVAGVAGSVGQIRLDDVFVDSSAAVPAGASVPLRGVFSNDAQQPDRLVSVTTPAASSVRLTTEDGADSAQGIDLPATGSVDLTEGAVRMQLEQTTAPIPITQLVPVTFVFQHAGQVRLDVPVTVTQ
jgi:copper(I)-binding protein